MEPNQLDQHLQQSKSSSPSAMVGIGSSCGACKFLRRKCEENCIFSPYFGYDHAESHFAAVHKVFGASNVSKLLAHLPICSRSAAAATVSYEAQARIRDPVRGCVSHILALQLQIASLQEEIESLTMRMVSGSIPEAVLCGSSDNVGEFEPRLQEMQPGYKEAMDRADDCLFGDGHSSWEELAMYLSELERDLLY